MSNQSLCFRHFGLLLLALICSFDIVNAQSISGNGSSSSATSSNVTAAPATSGIPSLVRFSGVAKEVDGASLSGTVGVTFAIYKEQQGGAALWLETQNVQPDSSGQYSVMLGATKAEGLPTYLFASGEARWLGVQISGQAEQPRVLLLSVPYAMKAADADTVGGLPASAFLLATPLPASPGTASSTATTSGPQPALTGVTPDVTPSGSGTAGFLPLWTTTSNLGNSVLYQASNGFIGINYPTPAVQLDIGGSIYVRGGFTVPQGADATASSGHTSHSINLIASAFNSSTNKAVGEEFQFQTAPVGNNTASPSGMLTLGFASGTNPVTLTGFSIASNGVVTFAPGQIFPGTVSDVTAGTGLTGGGTSSNVTVNVDSTKVPLLANANTFDATQTISNGNLNLPATTGASVGVLNIGGVPFLHGYTAINQDVYVGGAGNFTTTGFDNTGIGFGALAASTTGGRNTAVGQEALYNNSSGAANTAGGNQALLYNVSGAGNTGFGYDAVNTNSTGNFNTGFGGFAGATADSSLGTGSYNTALGAFAEIATGTLTNSTAVGANALVGQNNTLVLGNTTTTPGAEFVNVGIGTATPRSVLEASVSASGALGPVLTLTNSGSGSSNSASIDFNTYLPSSSGTYNPYARIAAVDNGFSESATNLAFYTNTPGAPNNGMQQNMVITADGRVQIDVSGDNASLDPTLTVIALQTSASAILGLATATEVVGVEGEGGNGAGNDGGGIGGVFDGGTVTGSGQSGDGIAASAGSVLSAQGTSGYAGTFEGNVNVTGTISSMTGDVKMDHPLDPANKYLVHASVESSEMMNIYTGNVVTDESGSATVALPSWFESLNTDFRYQLTTIGQDAHAWISQEVQSGKFAIRTNAPQVKVSWQITAVRQDAYAKAHPLFAEQEKPANERGYYIHPELYGQPEQKQTEWGRRPERMRHMEAMRERATQARNSQTAPASAKAASPQPASAVNRVFTRSAIPVPKPGTPGKAAAGKPVATVKP